MKVLVPTRVTVLGPVTVKLLALEPLFTIVELIVMFADAAARTISLVVVEEAAMLNWFTTPPMVSVPDPALRIALVLRSSELVFPPWVMPVPV